MKEQIVAIHQPNFLPWLGYFNKIVKSDTFVFFDHVQYPKTGSSWGNRVKFLISKEERWFTVPIKKKMIGLSNCNEIEFDDSKPWRRKLKNILKMNYGRCSYFKEVMELIENILDQETNNLTKFNIKTITMLLEHMDIKNTNLIKSSDLSLSSNSTQLLVDVVKAVGGNSYFAGGGAKGYQQDELFKEQEVKLLYQNYENPSYKQNNNEFTSGLSIIDALMNVGKTEVRSLLFNSEEND
mgnify:CR=1 FL=1